MSFSDRYDLKVPLGRTPGGIVWQAIRTKDDRTIAVAIADGEGLVDEGLFDRVRERFRRDLGALTKAKKGHLPKVHEVDEDDAANPYAAMELVPGESLASLMEAGEMDLETLGKVLDGVLRALEAAHRVSVFHGDIEPGNVLYDEPSGAVNLVGFGLNRALATTHGWGDDPGDGLERSKAYRAPELGPGELPSDARADLYAIGAILHRALAKEAAVAGRSIGEVAPEMGASMVKLIDRALEPDPQSRFASAWAMRTALNAAVRMAAKGEKPPSVGRSGGKKTLPGGMRAPDLPKAPQLPNIPSSPPPAPAASNKSAPPPAPAASNKSAPPPAPAASNKSAPPPAPAASNKSAPPPAPKKTKASTPPPAPKASKPSAPPPAPGRKPSTPPPAPGRKASTPPPAPKASKPSTPPPAPKQTKASTPPPAPKASKKSAPPPPEKKSKGPGTVPIAIAPPPNNDPPPPYDSGTLSSIPPPVVGVKAREDTQAIGVEDLMPSEGPKERASVPPPVPAANDGAADGTAADDTAADDDIDLPVAAGPAFFRSPIGLAAVAILAIGIGWFIGRATAPEPTVDLGEVAAAPTEGTLEEAEPEPATEPEPVDPEPVAEAEPEEQLPAPERLRLGSMPEGVEALVDGAPYDSENPPTLTPGGAAVPLVVQRGEQQVRLSLGRDAEGRFDVSVAEFTEPPEPEPVAATTPMSRRSTRSTRRRRARRSSPMSGSSGSLMRPGIAYDPGF